MPHWPGRWILEVGVLEDHQLVLLLVVAVLLIGREHGQGDVVRLDDLGHELVVILGITIVRGVVEVHGVLDVEDRCPADHGDVGISRERDRILGGDLGGCHRGLPLLELGGRVLDLLGPLADDELVLGRGWLSLGLTRRRSALPRSRR